MELPPTHAASPVRLRRHLLGAGVSDPELRAATRDGSVARVDRGAYVPRADAATTAAARYRHRVEAAAARSPDLVISHASGAVLYRMPLWGAVLTRVHQIRPGSGGGSKTAGRQVHSGRLVPDEIATVDGIRVTSPARTMVDLARTMPFQTAVIAADHALHRPVHAGGSAHRPLVTPDDLVTALQRAAHLPGAGAARRALRFADGRSESVGESRTRLVMHACGLPAPELQIDVLDGEQFIGRVDLGYPEVGVMIEFDGESKYGKLLAPGMSPSEAVIREKNREDELRRLGLVVVRLAWHELADRTLVRERIGRAIGQGRTVAARGGMTATLVPRPPIRIVR